MNGVRHIILTTILAAMASTGYAQFENSGISAGFFDSSDNNTINFSTFHLPPLAVLYENAKQNPQILSLNKAQEIAQAEVAKQKRHIFSYVYGHASYSYGKTDMWGNNNSTQSYTTIYQYQGNEQSYWNVGVNVSVPLEDILDLAGSVKRKKLEVDQARLAKDIAFDELKRNIASLYIKITNTLVTLKTVSPFVRLYAQEESAYLLGDGSLTYGSDSGNASVWYYDGTKLYNFSGGFNSAAQFSNAATVGMYSIAAGDALGKSFAVEDVAELPVGISAAGYATLYSPVALAIPAGVTAYIASDNGDNLLLTAIESGVIPANTGVILAGDAGNYSFALTTGGSVEGNVLTGTITAISRPENSYILATGTSGVGFYKDGATTIPGFKAYLPASAGGDVKTFRFDDDATGINEELRIKNEESSIYNLAGQMVNGKLQKGIYIVNGKKIMGK